MSILYVIYTAECCNVLCLGINAVYIVLLSTIHCYTCVVNWHLYILGGIHSDLVHFFSWSDTYRAADLHVDMGVFF